MKVDHKLVFVPSKTVNFPSLCPECLGKTDLTSYTSKWETSYLGDSLTKITEKAKIKIPICRSCKRALLRDARILFVKLFAVVAPICWGILYIILVIFDVEIAGDWGALLVIVLGGTPLLVLYWIISPHGQIGWPVTLENPNTFSFTNETYAKLFEDTNRS